MSNSALKNLAIKDPRSPVGELFSREKCILQESANALSQKYIFQQMPEELRK